MPVTSLFANLVACFILLCGAIFIKFVSKRISRPLRDLQGPDSPSFLLGHEKVLRYQNEVGDLEFDWMAKYGTAWRIKSCLDEDVLMLADAKALQHVFHKSSYLFPKPKDILQNIRMITGNGIIWVSGDEHKRHRSIMNPAFSALEIRRQLNVFQEAAAHLNDKLKEEVESGASVVNMSRWLARMTLDAIGEAAFSFQFGSLEDSQTKLGKSYENLFMDSSLHIPSWDILFKSLWRYIPNNILRLVEYLPTREYRRFKNYLDLSKDTAAQLIEEKAPGILESDEPKKDILSVIVRAYLSQDSKFRLGKEETLSQMSTMMLAGHETTSSALSWLLYELSHHKEDQETLRKELASYRDQNLEDGQKLGPMDFDKLPFLNAVIKEAMRLHPIVPSLVREAAADDVIPLSSPVVSASGKRISEIRVEKGQRVFVSICSYNRLTSVWGDDANIWNPRRHLQQQSKEKITLGMYGNLMSFSAGVRGCIGWRFALLEMQSVLSDLIETFDFSWPKDTEILRTPAGIMIPTVKGEMHLGTQMPLELTLIE